MENPFAHRNLCVAFCLIPTPHGRYVLSAPSRQLETLPGTLMLTDCLEACQANESCSAVNYETGLCVMFRSTADQLPGEWGTIAILSGHSGFSTPYTPHFCTTPSHRFTFALAVPRLHNLRTEILLRRASLLQGLVH